MKTFLNINELNGQIQQYIRRIKSKQSSQQISNELAADEVIISYRNNDLRSNLNTLGVENKFNIQNMLENEANITSLNYVTGAYEHLTQSDDKNKIVIDFMHKNNRNFDVKA